MKEFRQCYICQWNYLIFYLNIQLKNYNGNYYCPLCIPMPNQDEEQTIINNNRKELGRIIYMLDDNSTPEQIEAEILKERNSILSMTTEELEAHIDELDKLYNALQIESKKVKIKSISSLEERRSRGMKIKKSKEERSEEKALDKINALMAAVRSNK